MDGGRGLPEATWEGVGGELGKSCSKVSGSRQTVAPQGEGTGVAEGLGRQLLGEVAEKAEGDREK